MIKMFKELVHFRFLLWELIKKGIKLKYRRSYLGILWSMIEPLLTTVVLVIVFGTLFQNKNPAFPLYIICGRLIYSYFSSATKAAAKSIRNNSAMIKKVYVPKFMYPLADTLYNFAIFILSLLALAAVQIYCRVVPTYHMLWLLVAFLLLVILTTGAGFLLSTVNTFFRDIEYVWNVLLLLIMYMSAIFYYPEKLLKSGYAFLLNYNPLYQIILIARSGIFGDHIELWTLGYASAFSICLLIIGILFFKLNEDKFILHI